MAELSPTMPSAAHVASIAQQRHRAYNEERSMVQHLRHHMSEFLSGPSIMTLSPDPEEQMLRRKEIQDFSASLVAHLPETDGSALKRANELLHMSKRLKEDGLSPVREEDMRILFSRGQHGFNEIVRHWQITPLTLEDDPHLAATLRGTESLFALQGLGDATIDTFLSIILAKFHEDITEAAKSLTSASFVNSWVLSARELQRDIRRFKGLNDQLREEVNRNANYPLIGPKCFDTVVNALPGSNAAEMLKMAMKLISSDGIEDIILYPRRSIVGLNEFIDSGNFSTIRPVIIYTINMDKARAAPARFPIPDGHNASDPCPIHQNVSNHTLGECRAIARMINVNGVQPSAAIAAAKAEFVAKRRYRRQSGSSDNRNNKRQKHNHDF